MSYDYIVVGAGSAGCATAGRLVAEHGARVLLIESGTGRRNMFVDLPAGSFKIMATPSYGYLKYYTSVPQPSLEGRTVDVAQGSLVGGGSSVNAMAYGRGVRADYDAWDEAIGSVGWGWDDILPHFVRQEGNQRLNGPAHGCNGPLKVSDPINTCHSSDLLIPTLAALGIAQTTDFNDGDGRGVGYFQTTTHRGRRCSAANAFIDPLRGDPRLTLLTDATVTSVIFEGARAIGVTYVQGGEAKQARCEGEIILTAGAYVSPKLLMLSGIGPAADLARHGIKVRVNLPGVGQNMQDHNAVPLAAHTNGAYGYFGQERGWRAAANFIRYKLTGTGPVASNGTETTAYLNLDDRSAEPNLQIYNIPLMWITPEQGMPSHGLTLLANLLHPRSRGWMRLRSADPLDDPEISPNFLSDPEDAAMIVRGFRFLREIAVTEPLASIIRQEVAPGATISTDEEILAYCKSTTFSNYHPVGSCRMGPDNDPMAVLDPLLRVRGVEGLRVFDASMMPGIPRGPTNAPVMAIADRGVALLTGQATLNMRK